MSPKRFFRIFEPLDGSRAIAAPDKKSAIGLHPSHQQLIETLESITDAFFALDKAWNFTYLNSYAGKLLQRDPKDLLGKNIWRAFPEAVGMVFDQQYHRAIQENVAVQFESFYPPLNCWFEVRAYPNSNGLAVYFQNIDDRKRTEAALRQSEAVSRRQLAELETIYATAPIGLCVHDTELRFVRINDRMAQINGFSAADHVGRTMREILPELADILEPLHRQVLETGEPILNREIRGATAAEPGVLRDWLASYHPLKAENGQVLGINVMVQEITEHKRVEAALRFLADVNHTLVTTFDLEETIERVAHLAVPHIADWCVVDLLSEEGVVTRSTVVHRDSSKAEWAKTLEKFPPRLGTANPIAQVITTGQPHLAPNTALKTLPEITHNDEHLQALQALNPTSAMTVPLIARDQILGALTFGSTIGRRPYTHADLSLAQDLASRAALAIVNARLYQEAMEARQAAEQSLNAEQAARNAAEAASRTKDEFLAIVSHELRSPLNAMLGWAKLLRTRKLDEATSQKALEIIERNAEAQTQLIEDLLDISRIIRGKIRLDRYPVNIATVVEAAIGTVRPAADKKQIQIEFEPPRSQWVVSADRDRLQQVVWNLLSNAIKFTPDGGRVSVKLAQINAQVQLQITDTGKGIRPDFLPHVFDRFRQAENATTRSTSGLGLGLAIVQNLVELHGGRVSVESPGEGQGATFAVLLPLLPQAPAHDHAQPSHADEPSSLVGTRILVVDDELDTREFLTTALEMNGAIVVTAASTREALRLLQQWQPDLLISDIGMPGEDGYALIRQVRALPSVSQIPAAALTAFAREDDRHRALASGFQVHLSKPIVPAQLIQALEKLLSDLNAGSM